MSPHIRYRATTFVLELMAVVFAINVGYGVWETFRHYINADPYSHVIAHLLVAWLYAIFLAFTVLSLFPKRACRNCHGDGWTYQYPPVTQGDTLPHPTGKQYCRICQGHGTVRTMR